MNSLKFKQKELKHLAYLLKVPPLHLKAVIANVKTSYENEYEEIKKNKETGINKTYKDGTNKKRLISPSSSKLKLVQKRIKENILSPIVLPENIQGSVKKKSNITNAKFHQGNKYIFTTDLLNFFPSITSRSVYNTFLHFGLSNPIAEFLTSLTTYKGKLPQGAPTSSHVANIVFLQTDIKIIDFCSNHGIKYSRYIDDLTFSASSDFKHLLQSLLEIVKGSGLKINYRKTNYKGNQVITGIPVFNNYIGIPDKVKIKTMVEKKNGLKNGPYSNYSNQIKETNNRKKGKQD